jgi:hypothetical protein
VKVDPAWNASNFDASPALANPRPAHSIGAAENGTPPQNAAAWMAFNDGG